MASLYRQRYTKKIPASGEVVIINGEQKVQVIGKGGVIKIYDYVIGQDGQSRMAGYSNTWNISYRDIDGKRKIKSTGCRDKTAARAILAKIEQQLEYVKVGLISKYDLEIIEQRDVHIQEHFKAYMQHIDIKTVRGRAISKTHKDGLKQKLMQLFADCKIEMFEDITIELFENWMRDAKDSGKGPRTINGYRSAMMTFCNWAVKYKRMKSNPIAGLFKADESADIRHERRSLATEEVGRLLKVAELRPVAEFGRLSKTLPCEKGKRQKWKRLPITWETLDECYARGVKALEKTGKNALKRYQKIGQRRKLAYRVLLTTGLRKGELKAITPDRLDLIGNNPFVTLPSTATKRPKGLLNISRYLRIFEHYLNS